MTSERATLDDLKPNTTVRFEMSADDLKAEVTILFDRPVNSGQIDWLLGAAQEVWRKRNGEYRTPEQIRAQHVEKHPDHSPRILTLNGKPRVFCMDCVNAPSPRESAGAPKPMT